MTFTYNHVIFAIAFLVLMGLIVILHSKHFTGLCSAPNGQNSTEMNAERKPVGSINARHVAAITAAVLTATHGRGRIVNIAPSKSAASFDTTRRWRATAIVEAVGRRLRPSWKR